MTIVNLNNRSGGSGTDFKLLETDVYRCKIVAATMEEDQYAEPLNDGSKPIRLVIRWEVTEATDDQDEESVGCAVWQRFNPYYGDVRDGGPSKFKAFIDSLREQGHFPEFDANAFDLDALLDIEQRVSVENYKKTMGPNVGKPGNKVTGILPLKRAKKNGAEKTAIKPIKNAPVEVEVEDLPF